MDRLKDRPVIWPEHSLGETVTGAINFCRVWSAKWQAPKHSAHSHPPSLPAHKRLEVLHAGAPASPPTEGTCCPLGTTFGLCSARATQAPCSPSSLGLPAPCVVSPSQACPAPWTARVCSASPDFLLTTADRAYPF